MIIVGLTGSIGMGKSTAARYIASRGIPVFDADAAVHRLYEGEAVAPIEAAFPGTAVDGRIDRTRLSIILQADPSGFARLEAIIHPLVRRAEWQFLHDAKAAGAAVAVLDIPLLFETGADALMDATIVVSAPPETQRDRVLPRPGMTEEKFQQILARQMPDAAKRARATFVVDTSGPAVETQARLDAILEDLQSRIGHAYDRWRASPPAP